MVFLRNPESMEICIMGVRPKEILSDYRSRIYESYVHARQERVAPDKTEGLAPRLPLFNRIIRRHLPKNSDAAILELGCGHGAFLYALRNAGYSKCEGVDRSPEQIAVAKRLGIGGITEDDLMRHLAAAPNASRQVVITFDVIEHFTKPELMMFVDEVYRVLCPGGTWIIHSPNGESLFGARMHFWDFTHELAFTRSSITQLLMASGFSTVTCEEDGPVPHGVISAIRWVLWQMIRGVLRFYLAVETGSISPKHIFTQNLLAVAIK
jgi:2-polyprenyl-3-methyl-5-hydroxy-6-metoxy-1,4-benzoquinol methylase